MTSATDRTDWPVVLLYNLDYTWSAPEIEEAVTETEKLEAGLRSVGQPVTVVLIDTPELFTPLQRHQPGECVVLNWCEGVPGVPYSDALVAHTLEALQFTYTGSQPAVLALSQNKRKVKRRLEAQGVPTPRWRIYTSVQIDGWDCFPSIVKPAYEHCSIGVTSEAVATTPDELRQRIAYVLDTHHQPALVEDFIDGREFHVSLWGNGSVHMLPPAEMDFSAFADVHDRLCTYGSKFDASSVHYKRIQTRLPAPLTEDEQRALQEVCTAAYRAVGCRDYARLDVRLRDGVFYVLDVNPNADISSESSLACAAELAGYSFGALGSRLVNLAAARHPVGGRQADTNSYD